MPSAERSNQSPVIQKLITLASGPYDVIVVTLIMLPVWLLYFIPPVPVHLVKQILCNSNGMYRNTALSFGRFYFLSARKAGLQSASLPVYFRLYLQQACKLLPKKA